MKKIIVISLVLLMIPFTFAKKKEKPKPCDTPAPITIQANLKDIKNELMKIMIAKGYEFKSETERDMIFAKQAQMGEMSDAIRFLFSPSIWEPDSTPEEKVIYNFIEENGEVQIITFIKLINSPGSSHETTHEIKVGFSACKIQEYLNELIAKFEKPANPDIPKP